MVEQVDESSLSSKGYEEIDPDFYNREPPPNGIKIDDELIIDKWIDYQAFIRKTDKEVWCFYRKRYPQDTILGKVKGEDQSNDIFDTLLNLIRIGHLSKQVIDNNLYDAVLGIHVVGLQATIYVTCLLDYGLCTMLEICSITMPRYMSSIRSYISSCEDLLPLCDLYKNHCRKSNEPETLKQKVTQGISEAVFKKITNTSKNRPFIANQ